MTDDNGVRVEYDQQLRYPYALFMPSEDKVPVFQATHSMRNLAAHIRKAIADARSEAFDEAIEEVRKDIYLKKGDPANTSRENFRRGMTH